MFKDQVVFEKGEEKILVTEKGIFIQIKKGCYSWRTWESLMSHKKVEQEFKKLYAKTHDFYEEHIDEYTSI
jgi:hypothetical protein